MTTSPSRTPPEWPHCAHGADPATDPVGCRGVRVPGHTACLAHLTDADRDAYLARLSPGDDVDHRGTTFTGPLLIALLGALRDPDTGPPRFGNAWFEEVTFEGEATFDEATFEGNVRLEWATFEGDAGFSGATFKDDADFTEATFKGDAWFEGATFKGDAWFAETTFKGNTTFAEATFKGNAWFESATFEGSTEFVGAIFKRDTWFEGATFEGDTWFESATFKGDVDFELATFDQEIYFRHAVFERWVDVGPLVCGGVVELSGALFNGPTVLRLAAKRVECHMARWLSTAELRLRYATVDLAHAVLEYPLTIATEPAPFLDTRGKEVDEQKVTLPPDPGVRVASLRGVDAAHLVLADVDLSRCLFTGTVNLDQVQLQGDCTFAGVPTGTHWQRWLPMRFTTRRTLVEEHYWRARQRGAVPGWNPPEEQARRVGPAQLAPVYRALRKAFEDGKNEPGAADFYYGEMEMRRHDPVNTSRGERALLHAYWALSGYGLRAARALGWLAVSMLATIVLLMGWGLPQEDPQQEATGVVPPGRGRVTFTIEAADPRNPTGDRWTGERFEKALNITLNSVVFRSSGQELTTTGTYVEMTSRFVEPALLALAILAVRQRIKR